MRGAPRRVCAALRWWARRRWCGKLEVGSGRMYSAVRTETYSTTQNTQEAAEAAGPRLYHPPHNLRQDYIFSSTYSDLYAEASYQSSAGVYCTDACTVLRGMLLEGLARVGTTFRSRSSEILRRHCFSQSETPSPVGAWAQIHLVCKLDHFVSFAGRTSANRSWSLLIIPPLRS